MKLNYINKYIAIFSFCLLMVGCSDILEETPRGNLTPDFFKTETGVKGGVTALYANLRNIYGQGYFYNACQTGTDEVTFAQSADENFKAMDLSGVAALNPANSRADVLWNTAYSSINTANGVIQYGTAVGTIPETLISEARFFRAFNYFMLVQTFGGVPLDLGSGELAFNISTSRFSVRNTVPEVYTKAIFPDLLTAITNLPNDGRVTGGVTKTAARLYLAKAYLTYAWWLENPNNIPTYPETPRTDPDGHNAQWYYQKAYDTTIEGIRNPGKFKLQETFYDVNVGSNDRNSEILLYADHTENSELYNEASLTYGTGGSPENFAVWMMTWNYTSIRSANNANWIEDAAAKLGFVSSVQREAAQPLGRPWTRMCPTIDVVTTTFADKVNDSRYDGTFTTVFRGNWDRGGLGGKVYNANGMEVHSGDAILTFLNDEPAQTIDYKHPLYGKNGIGAGVLPNRADFVVSPQGISRLVYPGLWKLGVYRTDNGTGLGQPNAASTRPFNIAKFSELYLVAAEAAVKGAVTQPGMTARELVNVLRERAGKWRWDNNRNATKIQDNSTAMVAATPAVITIDYILDERSREFYGEGFRWYDLVRTQKWSERAATYQICGSNLGDHTPITYTRTIKPFNYLRPVPQGQFDAMVMSDEQKIAYQNPGY